MLGVPKDSWAQTTCEPQSSHDYKPININNKATAPLSLSSLRYFPCNVDHRMATFTSAQKRERHLGSHMRKDLVLISLLWYSNVVWYKNVFYLFQRLNFIHVWNVLHYVGYWCLLKVRFANAMSACILLRMKPKNVPLHFPIKKTIQFGRKL